MKITLSVYDRRKVKKWDDIAANHSENVKSRKVFSSNVEIFLREQIMKWKICPE